MSQGIHTNLQENSQETNDRVSSILERIDPDLLIPELYRVNQWKLNTFGDTESGIAVTYLYLRHPEPRFDLDALYHCFKTYLRSIGIDHNSTVKIGGPLHKYKRGKRVLSLTNHGINPSFIDQRYRSNVTNVTARKLTFRLKHRGFTLVFFSTNCSLYLHKNYELEEFPREFVRKLLKELHYPKFVIQHWVSRSEPKYFWWWYNGIKHDRSGSFTMHL